jgi:hypothetical protein
MEVPYIEVILHIVFQVIRSIIVSLRAFNNLFYTYEDKNILIKNKLKPDLQILISKCFTDKKVFQI